MAIYFNERLLEPKPNGTALERRYARERDEVKELFDKFRKPGVKDSSILFGRSWKKVWNNKKTSYKPAPPIAIPMNVHIYDDELGSVEIRYSKRPPIRSGNKIVWPSDSESLVFEQKSVSEQRLDFAWFLLKASNYVEQGIIKLIDKEAEYAGTFSSIKRQLEASKMIFDDNATLDRIKAIADIVLPKKMAVKGDTKEEVATRFWEIIVKGSETNKAYNYEAVIEAGKKLSEAKAEEHKEKVDKNLISVETADGNTYNVPEIKCPTRTKKETLELRAEDVGVPVEGLDRDELYSLIRFKEAELSE